MKSELLGFVRRSNDGKVLKISINKDAFNSADKHTTQDGNEYVSMVIKLESIYQLIEGQKDVTSVIQITE